MIYDMQSMEEVVQENSLFKSKCLEFQRNRGSHMSTSQKLSLQDYVE